MLGHLEFSAWSVGDLQCPHCKAQLAAEWTTEYGDPMPGDHTADCPGCNQSISFDVEVTTTYTVKKES
jgi:hypothetical protein